MTRHGRRAFEAVPVDGSRPDAGAARDQQKSRQDRPDAVGRSVPALLPKRVLPLRQENPPFSDTDCAAAGPRGPAGNAGEATRDVTGIPLRHRRIHTTLNAGIYAVLIPAVSDLAGDGGCPLNYTAPGNVRETENKLIATSSRFHRDCTASSTPLFWRSRGPGLFHTRCHSGSPRMSSPRKRHTLPARPPGRSLPPCDR